ncbi:hypothetical protein CK203_004186 [Vitis vinifera]|uniref:CCHC-type domain-containing protein n=1 Tax=Vitis vinifera TaxID=29760 RepID=A0A438K9B0_VITVI|nr:hypothetical protein CK203_004186 [Vitis vinifera]
MDPFSVPVSLHSHASSVLILNGTNFSDWSEQVQFHLGVLDIDLALRTEKPPAITEESSVEEKTLSHSWERSNRLSIMFMRMSIANNIKSTLPERDTAKEFFKTVEERFHSADKSLAGTLMVELTTMKFDGTRGMHEHILEMSNLVVKLKALGMNVDESFLVQFILNSLPLQYGPFQIHYNTIKDKWNVNELASMLVQEETRLKQQRHYSIHLISKGASKKWKKPKKGKRAKPPKINGPTQRIEVHERGQNSIECRFCKKFGHVQRDCHKRKAWFEKKGSTIHVSNSMQGFLTIQTLNQNESSIVVGNGVKVPVVATGTFRLFLDTD